MSSLFTFGWARPSILGSPKHLNKYLYISSQADVQYVSTKNEYIEIYPLLNKPHLPQLTTSLKHIEQT